MNLNVTFTHPWLLLLLIPAAALILIPYFRLSPKFRRTRNRILSVIFSVTGLVCAVLLLSGIGISYTKANDGNEVILLVDVSETEQRSARERDDFVELLLDESKYDKFRVGIVTFGYDQVYAVPLSDNVRDHFDRYLEAELPDVSATNIAGALNFAAGVFSEGASKKIVLITDGKETDESALSVIRAINASGVKVDAAYIPSAFEGEDVQIVSVNLPDYHVKPDDECRIGVNIFGNAEGYVTIDLYDNGVLDADAGVTVEVAPGSREVALFHVFKEDGFHELEFSLSFGGDSVSENNKYFSYFTLDNFNKILIIESNTDESVNLQKLLTDGQFEVTVVDASSEENMPARADDLRKYDQVILNNIANADLPEGFDEILDEYVRIYGGGLLTVGGSDGVDARGNPIAHAYNREDMNGTLLQKMLPIQVIDYTPPIGVMIVLDVSGSMSMPVEGFTKIKWAVDGAINCLDVLTERDYVGFMTLATDFSMIINMTPLTQKEEIKEIMRGINIAEGSTIFPGAIERASLALRAVKNVDKRHIILITDGEVPNDQRESYENTIDRFYRSDGITLSVISIGMTQDSEAAEKMREAVDLGGGNLYMLQESNIDRIFRLLIDDLSAPIIRESNPEDFYPTIYNTLSPVFSEVERGTDIESKNKMAVTLGGFYGVRVRSTAELLLTGDYDVPVYAQWKYGKGTVGSFMSDLKGTADSWSADFMNDESGVRFIHNVVKNLMPVENIRPSTVSVKLNETNYTNYLSVVSSLEEGEYIEGVITTPDGEDISLNSAAAGDGNDDCYVTVPLSADTGYSRCSFAAKKSGVYTIELKKFDKDGVELSRELLFKSFSYSDEYVNTDRESEEGDGDDASYAFLKYISNAGGGALIEDVEDPTEVFSGFETRLRKDVDPRFFLAITAIVCLLADVFVRKFKFKWIHELIKERKARKVGGRY